MKERFELKYVIPKHVVPLLVKDMECFVQRDGYVINDDGSYQVNGIYLDTPNLNAYKDKLAGIFSRKKYRLRWYNGVTDKINLEIKERTASRIIKTKMPIAFTDLKDLVLENRFKLTSYDPSENLVLTKFRNSYFNNNLKPIVYIQYRRIPFVSSDGLNTRITFDYDILAGSADVFERKSKMVDVLGKDNMVLEFKFFDQMPFWVMNLIRKFGLQDQSYSKYCESVSATHRKGMMGGVW
ncbi:MAG: polyphosphate polymerase domain-containing protein [Bdellovibrionales bacterium]